MDLGVAKLLDATVALTRAGQFTGTVLYAAPEQFRDDRVGPASDLYALGVLLYELATGRNPFFRRDPVAVIQAHIEYVPPAVNDVDKDFSAFASEVVRTLMAKEAAERFSTAGALRAILEEAESSRWWSRREAELLRRERRLPRIPVQRRTALHGRAEALDTLQRAWQSAADGSGGFVLVEGEAGIGKSRVLDALLERAGRERAHVLYGAFGLGGGLTGLTDAIVGFLGAGDLEAALTVRLEEHRELVPALAARLRGQVPPPGAANLDAEGLATLLCRLAGRLAADRPVLWLVDDVHLAREEGLSLLRALARAARQGAVLLVATAHPGASAEALRGEGSTVALGRLGARDVVELLTDALQNDVLAERLSGRIAAASDGVPLFVFELLRVMGESKALEQRPDGRWTQTGRLTEIDVPPDIRALMFARLAEIADEDRELLDVAAIQGHAFDAGLVAAVLEAKRVHVLRRLAVLERRSGMVRARGGRYVFDQRQLQETLRAEVPPELAGEYHALLAEAYEARVEGTVEGEDAVFLATHHLQGIRPVRALDVLVPALDHLERALRNDEFLDLARLAVSREGALVGRDRAVVLMRWGERLTQLGVIREVVEPLDEALDLLDTFDDDALAARIRFLEARTRIMQADLEGAREVLEVVKRLARAAGAEELEARTTGMVGVLLDNTGRSEEGLPYLREHLAVARALGDEKSEMIAACNLGLALRNTGARTEAREMMERQLELAVRVRDPRAEAIAYGNLSLVADDAGEKDLAREYLHKNVELARRTGSRQSEAAACGNLGLDYVRNGELEEAWAWIDRERTLAEELGDHLQLAHANAHLAGLLQRLGRPELAARTRAPIVRVFRDLGRARDALDAEHHTAWSLWDAGHTVDARRLQEETIREAETQGLATALPQLLLGLARMEEDPLAVDRLADRAVGLAPDDDRLRLHFLALGATSAGDARAVAARLPAHQTAFRDLERDVLLWKATGDAEALASAKRRLEALTRSAPPAYRASMRDGLPMYREISSA